MRRAGAEAVRIELKDFRRVQILVVEPNASRPGYRCKVCGRLQLTPEVCQECRGEVAQTVNVYEEAVLNAVEQAAHVHYWDDPQLKQVNRWPDWLGGSSG